MVIAFEDAVKALVMTFVVLYCGGWRFRSDT